MCCYTIFWTFFTRKQDLVISPTNEITGKLSESHISPSSLFIQFYKTCYKTNPVLNEHISTTKLPASLRHSHKHLAKEKKKHGSQPCSKSVWRDHCWSLQCGKSQECRKIQNWETRRCTKLQTYKKYMNKTTELLSKTDERGKRIMRN